MNQRHLHAATLALAALMVGGSLTAQGVSAFAGHTYQPGIDVLNYDITLDLPAEGPMLRGDVVVSARRTDSVHALRLDLVRTLTVREVEVGGRQVRAARDGDTILIPLDDA